MSSTTHVFPPRKAEIANSITHAFGIIFSTIAILLLFRSSAMISETRFGILAFAFCMFEMYSVSTIYHLVKPIKLKTTLRLFDHISIYFLIAGTYTPFILLCLQGSLKWLLLSVIWGIVVLGIVYKLVWWKQHPKLSLYIYLAMGWIIVFFIRPVYEALSFEGFLWLIGGGVLYSIGTIFYANRKPLYNHAVWHLFVLGGSICHFISILSI
ncbi:PAQR family membrane homeostasis protein TrhA [Paludibacter jiangxiensis]|uniref:Hemolysin III n=1 Tax=Paludibacter jiangxiensis TaxID=681398 RepID=A0A161L825_9BACT|nr:hemolysin III family protein [Paludibacter jiangxiensis]GAT63124.1 hemolysin III [Paludibacter jiangxiensis]